MDRASAFFRCLIAGLMLVGILVLAAHTGEMEGSTIAAADISHSEAASPLGSHATMVVADHDGHHLGDSKHPCKSPCCGVTCCVTLPAAVGAFVLMTGAVGRPYFPDALVPEDRAQSGIRRPPRIALIV